MVHYNFSECDVVMGRFELKSITTLGICDVVMGRFVVWFITTLGRGDVVMGRFEL